MLPINPEEPIRYRNTRNPEREAFFISGVICCILNLMGLLALYNGKPVTWLICVGVSVIGFVLAEIVRRKTPDIYLVLYPDRIVLTEWGDSETEVAWSDIESVRWPLPGKRSSDIRLITPSLMKRNPRGMSISMSKIQKSDKARLAGYIRIACQHSQHDNWQEYCILRAVPWLNTLEKSEGDGVKQPETEEASIPLFSKCYEKLAAFTDNHPFIAGFAFTLLGIPLFPIGYIFLSRTINNKRHYRRKYGGSCLHRQHFRV